MTLESPNINIVNLGYTESLKEIFQRKAEKMKTLNIKLENETKLKFYGLYKVATVGSYYSGSNKNTFDVFDFQQKYKKYNFIIS